MKRSKGITLIALVVTIVVLLILTAVSISMLTGENGVVTQAQNSKEETEQSKCEELVTVAINGLLADNLGDRSKITPQDIAEEVNRMENRTDIVAEGNTFPTNILFTEEDRKVGVNIEIAVTDPIGEGIYNEPGAEESIAPTSLFKYEIVNDGSTGSLKLSDLPEKTVRILEINPQYCNGIPGGGYTEDGEKYEDTNYDIIYNGEKISDTLVIPYQVDGKFIDGGIEGELYKVVEVDLSAEGILNKSYEFPNVETVIYPNTVEKISGKGSGSGNFTLKKVVLPQNLKEIGGYAFNGCTKLTNITIPKSVTSIGNSAFSGCESLTSIEIPNGVTSIGSYAFYECRSLTSLEIPNGVTSIGSHTFSSCTSLTSIEIPDGVTSIESWAFTDCTSLTSIEIPSSVTRIGDTAFSGCESLTSIEIPNGVTSIGYQEFLSCKSLTSITIPDSVTSIGSRSFENCDALKTINYTGTQEQWNAISGIANIPSGVTINYNYTGE